MAITKQEIVLEVKVDNKQGKKGAEEVTKTVESASEATAGLSSSLDRMTGGAVSGFAAMGKSIRTTVGGLKTLKGALAATGIGLLVVAIGSLITAFKSSEEGANKLAKITTVLGSVVDNLLDVVADIGEALIAAFENPQEALSNFGKLIKDNIVNRFEGLVELVPKLGQAIALLFEGEFAEAGKVAADAVGKVALGVESVTDVVTEAGEAIADFGKQVVEEAGQASVIADKRAKANKLERELLVERAKLESDIAALRLKSRQEDEFTAQERKDALLEAQALEDQLLQKETAVLTLRRDAQVEENKLARSSVENLNKEAEAIAAVERQEAMRLNQQRTTQRELNRLNGEIRREEEADVKAREAERAKELAEQQKLADELFAINMTAREKEELALMEAFDKRIAMAGDDEGLIMAATELFLQQEAELKEKYRKADEAAKEADAAKDRARTKAIMDQRVNLTLGALSALGALNQAFSKKDDANAEKAFKRNKAISIATATVNTGQAVVNALTAGGNPLKLATGAQFVEAAIAAATGAAQIATIARTQYEAPAAPDTSVPEPPSPTQSAASGGGATGAPQLDLSFLGAGQSQQAPIQAFVLADDVSTAQQANQQISEQASL